MRRQLLDRTSRFPVHRALCAVLLSACGGAAGRAEAPAQLDLSGRIQARLDSLPIISSVYVKDLKTGREIAIRADVPMNTASVIKMAVMIRAYRDAEAGKLDLNARHVIKPEEFRRGSGLVQTFAAGLNPTLRDLITQMIITSDNTATDEMTTRVGGVEALNTWLAASGYRLRMVNRGWEYRRKLLARIDPRFAAITAEEVTGLQYAMTGSPTFDLYRPLFTGDRAAWLDVVRDPANRRRHGENQRKLMVEDRDIWLGDITAREIARMLEAIERETIVSPASAATMRTFMRRQLAGSRRLPHFVDVPVAHKTGDAGNIANDVGIMYARSGPIVIAVLVTGITGSYGEAEDRIGRLAELVLKHFDGAATGAAR